MESEQDLLHDGLYERAEFFGREMDVHKIRCPDRETGVANTRWIHRSINSANIGVAEMKGEFVPPARCAVVMKCLI
jgi:hypothetical protein